MMPAPRANCSLTLLILIATLLVAVMSQPARAQTRPVAEPRSLLAASDADATWIARKLPTVKDEPTRWLVLRHAYASTEAYWTQLTTLVEDPIAIAPFGDRLAVLDSDGSWGFVDSAGRMAGPTLEGSQFEDVISTPRHVIFLTKSRRVVTFDGRDFATLDYIDAHPKAIQFVLAGPAVGFIPLRDNPDVAKDTAQSSDGRWFAHRFFDDSLSLWGPSLLAPDAHIALPAAARTERLMFTREPDGSAKFWWLDGDQIMGQAFDTSGHALGAPAALPVRPPPTPTLFERSLYIVGALALLLVLLAGGRQTIAVSKALAAKSPPKAAPLARRFAAGMIDCIPLAATVIYLIAGGKLTIYAGMLRFDGHRSEAILAAGVVFYLILLIAFELRWQFSIGKWIFALRVTTIDGQLPGPRAILIRNVLRLVDLNIITLLIVPATPLRQRLGDFLAGTMVVDAFDAIPSATPRAVADERSDSE